MKITDYLKENILYLDGGMGTLLQKRGLLPGELPETWNLTRPDVIVELHRAYYDAGSNVVNTNTFCANILKFTKEDLEKVVSAAIDNAKRARDTSVSGQKKWVALDIGPTGRMMSNTITKNSNEKYNELINAVPELNTDHIRVMHINKHLNESATIKNIRSLYSQKKSCDIQLKEIQTKIDNLNAKLATISYDDTSNLRSNYTTQLSEYNSKKNELVTTISKTIDAISLAANESEVPIENAKYRIRGFFDVVSFAKYLNIDVSNICGIQVQYRYKNVNQEHGTAASIGTTLNGERLFIFSDWNVMNGFQNPKITKWDNGYKFEPMEYNGNINEPSFNQIDIPISQGETVDIRLKVLYDYGRPFVEVTSAWSEIMNIKFPEEFLKDVQILDIISENNNDIETNRFKNIINDNGIPEHTGDKIIDQDITYFHKPESIASGFYTNERRIIPLKDKLMEINNSVQELKDEVMGTSADNISVSIANGDVLNALYPNQLNNISVEGWMDIVSNTDYKSLSGKETKSVLNGTYNVDVDGNVSTILNIMLTNNSDHTMKIYSMFPGSRDKSINELSESKYDKEDYCMGDDKGVWIKCQQGDGEYDHIQTANQVITFRIKDAYDGSYYYTNEDMTKDIFNLNDRGLTAYPYIATKNSLCLDSDAVRSYVTISPKSSIIIPLMVVYNINDRISVTKTISFDVRTSLYQDPLNYIFSITAKKANTYQDKLISSARKNYGIKDTNGWVKYNIVDVK